MTHRLPLVPLLLLSTFSTALSEDVPIPPCSGYIPEIKLHTVVGSESPYQIRECPAGQVMLGERIPAGHPGDPEKLELSGVCCPYPSNALTTEKVRASVSCPANYVVTGAMPLAEDKRDLICTKINTETYRLSPPSPSVYITERGGEDGPWNSVLRLFGREFTGRSFGWASIPPALRFGLPRVASDKWDYEFCTGYPWGAALTGKTFGRGCSYEHSVLTERSSTRPAKVYSDCLAIDSFIGADPKCIQRQIDRSDTTK